MLRCARSSGQLFVAVACASILHCRIVFSAEHAQFLRFEEFFFGFGVVYRRRGHVDLADYFAGGDYDGDSVIVTATSKLSLGVPLLGVGFWW